ncbi:hypothetical protein TI39_contig404g00001 [Zymoseptoria brevis]|uniref:F-box domain-containing protein n=1 Tax=Zymoseptoria brevis TaxID=1047168 RepID=A0A0F4GQW0_9PEZI|nr:hypothetical protein TI39_contig404g00001 [Zymoseptoria brevis]
MNSIMDSTWDSTLDSSMTASSTMDSSPMDSSTMVCSPMDSSTTPSSPMDSSTTPSSPPTRATLTGLPAELRLLIFSHAMSSSTVHIRPSAPSKPPTTSIWSILHISPSLRAELLPLFFSAITFHLREDLTSSNLKSWLALLSPQSISSIRTLTLHAKRICTGRWPPSPGSPTTTCTRTSSYHADNRAAQLADLAEIDAMSPGSGYRPSMFYNFAQQLCSVGSPTCMRRTMAGLKERGCEEWYLREGEGLTAERVVEWWGAMNRDYLLVEDGEERREV